MKECRNCSYQTEENIAYCPLCGNPIVDTSPPDGNQITSSPEEKPKKNLASAALNYVLAVIGKIKQMKLRTKNLDENSESSSSKPASKWAKLSLIVISSIAVLGISAWVGYSIYLNNNPKFMYFIAESTTMKHEKENISSMYDQEYEYWRALNEDSFSFAANIRTKSDMDFGMDHYLIDLMESLNILDNVALSLQGGRDKKSDWSELSVELLEGRRAFADLTLQQDQGDIYLASDTLMDSSLHWTVDEVFGIESKQGENIDDSESFNNWRQALEFSKQEKETLQKWLKDYILSELPNQVFEVEKDASYSSPDGSEKMKKIVISLDELTLRRMLVSLIDDIRTDEKLLQMIVNRAETIVEMTKPEDPEVEEVAYFENGGMITYSPFILFLLIYSNAEIPYTSYTGEEMNHVDEEGNFNREAFEETLQAFLYELRFYFLDEFNGELFAEIYVNKKNIIVDRYVELIISDNEDESSAMKMDWTQSSWKDKSSVVHTNDEVTLNIREYGEMNTLKLYRKQTFEKEKKTGFVDGEIGFSVREGRSSVVDISADYSIEEALGGSGVSHYDILLSLMSDGERLNFDIQAERDKNLKRDTFEQQLSVQTDFTVPVMLDHSVSFTLNTTIDFMLDKGTPPLKSSVNRGAQSWADMNEDQRDQFRYEFSDRMYRQFSGVFMDLLF